MPVTERRSVYFDGNVWVVDNLLADLAVDEDLGDDVLSDSIVSVQASVSETCLDIEILNVIKASTKWRFNTLKV